MKSAGNCPEKLVTADNGSEKEVFLAYADCGTHLDISKRGFRKNCKSGLYRARKVKGKRGAFQYEAALSSLPAQARARWLIEDISRVDQVGYGFIDDLGPELALDVYRLIHQRNIEKEKAGLPDVVNPSTFSNPKTARRISAVQEALEVPPGYTKDAWVKEVARKYRVRPRTVYRWIEKYNSGSLDNLHHTKPRGPRRWDPEAVEYWHGLILKREHRRMDLKTLYRELKKVAKAKGWKIGGYPSACKLAKELDPLLVSYRDGGARGLDNALPPILRDYSDLEPLEIVVGDQHRCDFWVIPDEGGAPFRPEGYLWQDLHTRSIYGIALGKNYNAQFMGLAFRAGMLTFGRPGCIYTDHGAPEKAKFWRGRGRELRPLGLDLKDEAELPIAGVLEDLEINQRLAKVRNAKAKLIERTFQEVERILRNEFRVPGHVADLGDDKEVRDKDHKELEKLLEEGQLLTFSEFLSRLFEAVRFYNEEKHHRGLEKEWKGPKPRPCTPMARLLNAARNGWRPRFLSKKALNLVFLFRASRVVDRGRVQLLKRFYEHPALNKLHKRRVELRYDPLTPEGPVLVFLDGRYVCDAHPVVMGSMKDPELTGELNRRKAAARRACIEEYRKLTRPVEGLLEFSKVERQASDRAKARDAEKEPYRVRAQEQLDAAAQEILDAEKTFEEKPKALPRRPEAFSSELERFRWCIDFRAAGGQLTGEDEEFEARYRERLDLDSLEYWEIHERVAGM